MFILILSWCVPAEKTIFCCVSTKCLSMYVRIWKRFPKGGTLPMVQLVFSSTVSFGAREMFFTPKSSLTFFS